MSPALGLILYLDQPRLWVGGLAAEAFDVFLELAPRKALKWLWSSSQGTWQRWSPELLSPIADGLSPKGIVGLRHLLHVRVADERFAPEVEFSYREVDRADGCTGFLELTLPLETPPMLLLRLATWAMRRWPIWSGVGGYKVSWDPNQRPTVSRALYPWLRRYLGLDAQDADAMAWKARASIPGSNWLNLVGEPLLAAQNIDASKLERRSWASGVRVSRGECALLLQAGDEPSTGDLQTLRYPKAYAEIASLLAPHFPSEWPRIFNPRPWQDEVDYANRWLRRFVAPSEWS